MKDWKKELFTVPNVLSLFRLVLIPVYVIIFINADSSGDYFLAAAILAVSCLTDLLDGQIARRFNMISTVGKILDPLADKVTQFTLILCLATKYSIIYTLVGLFFIKELFQLIAGGFAYKRGFILKNALFSGKICTTILFLSLILLIMIPTLPYLVVTIVAIVDLIFLLVAFADYIYTYATKGNRFQEIQSEE